MSKTASKIDDELAPTVSTVSAEGQPIKQTEAGLSVPGEEQEFDRIDTGAARLLEVPEEDDDDDDGGDGEDCNFGDQMVPEIRKPKPFELFLPFAAVAIKVTLLVLQKSGSYQSDYYHVDPGLRRAVRTGMKKFLVVPWYSFDEQLWCLWLVGTGSSKWSRSLRPLFYQDPEFYEGSAFTVETDDRQKMYLAFKYKAPAKAPTKPGRTTSLMLGQAIGARHFIASVDHPVYVKLTSGQRVS